MQYSKSEKLKALNMQKCLLKTLEIWINKNKFKIEKKIKLPFMLQMISKPKNKTTINKNYEKT